VSARPFDVPERDPNPPARTPTEYPFSGLRSEDELTALAEHVKRFVDDEYADLGSVLVLDYERGTFEITFGPHMNRGIVDGLLKKAGAR
jgi:hypothetical protein